MRPVLMEIDPDVLTPGEESYRAALASILDLPLDVVPAFEGLAAQSQFEAWLGADLNLGLYTFPQMTPGPGYWLARCDSPYAGYPVHTVVCRGGWVAHDPHPEQLLMPGGEKGKELSILQCELLVPLDPGKPSGKGAL